MKIDRLVLSWEDGTETVLNMDEARELYKELKEIFDTKLVYWPKQPPTIRDWEPIGPTYPTYTSGNTEELKSDLGQLKLDISGMIKDKNG